MLNKLIQQSLIWRVYYLLTAILLNVVYARVLQAGTMGVIYYLTANFTLFLLLVSMSMESAFTFHASGNLIDSNQLASFGILWSVFISILLFFFLGYYFSHVEKNIPLNKEKYVQYGLCFIVGMFLINCTTALFYAKRNFFLPNFLLGLLNLLAIVLLIAEKRFLGNSFFFETFFFAIPLVEGIILLIVLAIMNNTFIHFSLPTPAQLHILFRYSMMAALANITFFFVCRIDYWFVKYNCTANDLGNYTQASKLGQLFLLVPQVISSALFSQTASGELQKDVSETMVRLFRILLQVFMAAIILIVLTGSWAFPYIFGETFNQVQISLLFLMPGLLCLSILSLLSAFLGGKGNVLLNVKGSLYGLIVVISLNFLAAKHYSIYFAAIISSIGYATCFLYSFYHFASIIKFKRNEWWHFEKADWLWVKKVLINK